MAPGERFLTMTERTNLRVLKRSRKPPTPGDVFAMQLPDGRYLFGRVILADLPRVDLVKMDIELHEPTALRGMRRTLEQFRPTLLVEVLTEKAGEGVAAALDGLGYEAEPMPGEYNVLFRATG